MLRFALFAIFVVAIGTDLANGEASGSEDVDVITVESIAEYTKQNPHVQLREFERIDVPNTKVVVHRHTLGARIPRDRLVATRSFSDRWPKPHNARAVFRYPAVGEEFIVTFVEVLAQRSSTSRIYAIDGGIGRRRIIVMVEAPKTFFLSYTARIFGH